ncbi:hypothetical protein ABW19_dt0206549 [Dactylella cylindrospora]|nr:hypothetical protein ABW19_dt0206549 [Dactylella cylindrospora]
MVHHPLFVAALSAGLLAPLAAGMYAKNSPVLQLDHKNFEQKIMNSNHASVVEFYAPWCGHCKNLKPAYEKAADNLRGLANVAAIDCDDERNKQTCAKWGIQGFPTIKTFKPGKVAGKPNVEDYNGPRTAKGIVDWVIDRIPNHVKRVDSKTVDEYLSTNNETIKAILFTTKGVATPLYKSLAIDFLGSISFAQVRDKETAITSLFGIEKYPTLVVLPGGTKEGVVYDGGMKKDQMHKFLSGFAEPTEGKAAPKAEKKEKKKEKKETKEETSSSSSTTSSPPTRPTFDPKIPTAGSVEELASTCGKKTCILIVTPLSAPSLTEFEQTHNYLAHIKPGLFPFFQLPYAALTPKLREALDIEESEEIVYMRAVNAKKGWWIPYGGEPTHEDMKVWVDALRMGELSKKKLPEVTPEDVPVPPQPKAEDPVKEEEPTKETPKEEEPTKEEEPAPEPEPEPVEEPVKQAPIHEEL